MKRTICDRRLTGEEAAKYGAIRSQIKHELPALIARHHERMNQSQPGRRSMSHHQLFYCFRDGFAETFPAEPIFQLLKRHGFELYRVDDRHIDVRTPDDVSCETEIGECAGLFLENGDAIEFGITRPSYTDRFFSLAADLICERGLCMCSDAATGTYVGEESLTKHIPESVGSRPKVIRSAEELKRAIMTDDASAEDA